MSTAIIKKDDPGVTATLVTKDKQGNPAKPHTPPTWELSDGSVVTMDVAADGMSATFKPLAPGGTIVDVTVDADPGEAVVPIKATGQITVTEAGVETVDLTFQPITE